MISVGVRYVDACSNDLLVIMTDAAPICVGQSSSSPLLLRPDEGLICRVFVQVSFVQGAVMCRGFGA